MKVLKLILISLAVVLLTSTGVRATPCGGIDAARYAINNVMLNEFDRNCTVDPAKIYPEDCWNAIVEKYAPLLTHFDNLAKQFGCSIPKEELPPELEEPEKALQ